jgi:hypothetical protein
VRLLAVYCYFGLTKAERQAIAHEREAITTMTYTIPEHTMSHTPERRQSASSISRMSDAELKAYLLRADVTAEAEARIYGEVLPETAARLAEAESLYAVRLLALAPLV